jgi:anti-sigma factor RsiW
MTGCEDKRLLLGALVDDELDAANTVALEQHLKACPACARALSELRALQATLATPGLSYAAPEAFRRRLRNVLVSGSALSRPDNPRRAWASPAWLSGVATAALAGALGVLALQPLSPAITDELVSDHVRSMMGDHLIDVQTSDQHVVKPWFDGRVSFAPTVVDFAAKGFPLVGGRLEYVDRERAAALVYRRRLHIINVFIWPATGAPPVRSQATREGYNLVRWRAGGLEYWAVSDLELSELETLRQLFRDAQAAP